MDRGCMGPAADFVVLLASAIVIGLGVFEWPGLILGAGAGGLVYVLMMRKWFYRTHRPSLEDRRGGETFESDSGEVGGGD